jgi:hypothetical protein
MNLCKTFPEAGGMPFLALFAVDTPNGERAHFVLPMTTWNESEAEEAAKTLSQVWGPLVKFERLQAA